MSNLSHFLSRVDFRGTTWCKVEIGGAHGFRVGASEAVMFYCVLRGSVRLAQNCGKPITLRAGDVCMVLRGAAHALRSAPDSPVEPLDFLTGFPEVDCPEVLSVGNGPVASRVLCGKLKVDWPEGVSRLVLPSALTLKDEMMANARAAARVDTLQMCAEGNGASSLLTRMATVLFAIMLRGHPQCEMLVRLSGNRDPIARALELVRGEPACDWSVASLARRVGMSRSSFAARFNLQMGRTPMEMIRDERMEHAVGLLHRGDLSVKEISARAGYRSEAGFSRRFSQVFGIPPRAMRGALPASLPERSFPGG